MAKKTITTQKNFDKTWMNGQFRPHNYVKLLCPQWTPNNHLEGWYNSIKRVARKAHPNLYEVLEVLQREQAATKVTIQQLEAGRVRKTKRRKVIQWEEKIKSL